MNKSIPFSKAKGKSKSSPKSKKPKQISATKYAITLQCGTSKPKQLDAGKLDPAAIADIVNQMNQPERAGKPVTLQTADLLTWPGEMRSALWRLCNALTKDGTRTVKLIVGGKEYTQPADLVAITLAEHYADPAELSRALDFGAEILNACHKPEDQQLYLSAVYDFLRKKEKLEAQRCRDIQAQLKTRLKNTAQANGKPKGVATDGNSVQALAKRFLGERYQMTIDDPETQPDEQPDAMPVEYDLHYYDGTFYVRRPGVWVKTSVEDIRLELTRFLQQVCPGKTGTRHIGDVLANVKALCSISVDNTPPLPFYIGDTNRHMLAFENGLIDLNRLASGQPATLLSHDHNWFSTSRLPYEFDPKAKCPEFLKFLGQILNANPKTGQPNTPGDNRALVLQEMAGYTLLIDNRFQKFFVLLGKGWNGKGTFLDLLQRMIGAENISSVTLEGLGKTFGAESMVGKMVNMCGDMNEIDNAQEGTLKMWTGEDLNTVYRKYKNPLQIEPTLKFIFSTNVLPWFKDKTNGIWRRPIVIPFMFALKSDDEADPALRAKLRAELPGILNWALQGLYRLLAQKKFTKCDVCAAAAEKHRRECSPVEQFINTYFSFAADYPDKTGLCWEATTHAIKAYVKNHNEKYGEHINPNIVCRELANNDEKKVWTERVSTEGGRQAFGSSLFHGVCIGEPGHIPPPADEPAYDEHGAPLPPPSLTLSETKIVCGPKGKPITVKSVNGNMKVASAANGNGKVKATSTANGKPMAASAANSKKSTPASKAKS